MHVPLIYAVIWNKDCEKKKDNLRAYLLREPHQIPKSILKHKPLNRRNVVRNIRRWGDSFRLRTMRRTFHVMVNSRECAV